MATGFNSAFQDSWGSNLTHGGLPRAAMKAVGEKGPCASMKETRRICVWIEVCMEPVCRAEGDGKCLDMSGTRFWPLNSWPQWAQWPQTSFSISTKQCSTHQFNHQKGELLGGTDSASSDPRKIVNLPHPPPAATIPQYHRMFAPALVVPR